MSKQILPRLIVLIAFLNCIYLLEAQNKTEPEKMTFIYTTYALQIPGGDMADRFGINSDFGGGIGYKTKKNWIYSLDATIIFGNKLKEDPLEGIVTKHGQIIDMYGSYAPVAENERGLQIKMGFGRIIPVKKSNVNSGILIKGALGYIQHRIAISNSENSTPQIEGEYIYGYDRFCNGISVNEFIGWQQFGEKRPIHFMIGFEFTQAFTQNQRTWDFATNSKLKKNRIDLLNSLKIAIFIPIKQRNSTQYFYY
jgi:hypothetical protein